MTLIIVSWLSERSDLRKPSQVSQVSQSLIEGLLVPVWEGREPPGNRAMLIAAFLFSHFDRYSILYVAPNAYGHTLVRLCACCLPSYGELVPLHTHPHNRMKAMKPSLWRSDPTITLIYLVSYNGSEWVHISSGGNVTPDTALNGIWTRGNSWICSFCFVCWLVYCGVVLRSPPHVLPPPTRRWCAIACRASNWYVRWVKLLQASHACLVHHQRVGLRSKRVL